MRVKLGWLGIGALAAALTLGCASKFTRERFDMIQAGVDDQTDVREVLGKPRFQGGDHWYYEDFDRRISAMIYFGENGRVSGKEWMDALTGSWEGENPSSAAPPPGAPREQHAKTRTIDKN